jgi:hypothetical protein
VCGVFFFADRKRKRCCKRCGSNRQNKSDLSNWEDWSMFSIRNVNKRAYSEWEKWAFNKISFLKQRAVLGLGSGANQRSKVTNTWHEWAQLERGYIYGRVMKMLKPQWAEWASRRRESMKRRLARECKS